MTKLTDQEKQEYLDEHILYEITMTKYSFKRLMDPKDQLEWNSFYDSFFVHARLLYLFLRNRDEGKNNMNASDFSQEFKSRPNKETIRIYKKLNQQTFHIGADRPYDEGKITVSDIEHFNNFIEEEFDKFKKSIRGKFRWNEGREEIIEESILLSEAISSSSASSLPTMSNTGTLKVRHISDSGE